MKGCLNPKKQFEEGQQDCLVQQFRLQRPQRFEVIHWGRTSFSSPHWRGIKETLLAGCHRVAMSIVVIQAKKFKRSNHYTGQPQYHVYLIFLRSTEFAAVRSCCVDSTLQFGYNILALCCKSKNQKMAPTHCREIWKIPLNFQIQIVIRSLWVLRK